MRPAQHPQHQLESTHARGGVRSLIGRHRRRALAAIAGLLVALLAAIAPWLVWAATDAWTGLAPTPAFAATINAQSPASGFPCGGNWSNAGAWDLGRAPITGDVVVFGTNPPNAADNTNHDLGAGVQLLSLTVASTKVAGCSGNFIVTGGPIALQSGGSITDNWDNLGSDSLPGITLNGSATFTRGPGRSTLSITGAVTGTGPLTLTNNRPADGLRLTVANSYSGATTVSGASRVRADINGAIPTGSALTVDGSLLFQAATTIGSLAGGGNLFMNGSNTLTAGGDNTSTTFSGVYQNSGAAALIKAGTGALTLSGVNTYTGATTVNAGTLAVTGSIVSPVTVNSGGTLGGTGTINNTVTVNSGGTLSPGTSPGIINTGNLSLTS